MHMNYNIKGTGVSVSDEIRTYIEKRLEHTEKFLDDATAHVDIEVEYHQKITGVKYRAEFTLRNHAEVFRAEAVGENLHEAVDTAGNELAQEVRRSKKRHLRLMRHGAVKFKEFVRGFRRKI